MDVSETRAENLEATIRLALIPGVGPRTRRALLDCFGSPSAVFEAAPSALREVSGVGVKLTRAIRDAASAVDVDAIIDECRSNTITILTELDDAYPRLLREIYDPPGILFVRGQWARQDALAVAIVGTRHATHYGLRQAERLARGLARAGVTVVSGLARGIDAAAHRGALAAGGRTVAVLASGLRNIYPPEHAQLADQIAENGILLSEVPPRSPPHAGAFPQRNRLITGISLGTIVVEAAHRSGALISAEHAMEQGREVFAVPGRVDCAVARGCHRLLREGATLVERVEDVLDDLGPLVEAAPREDGSLMRNAAELQLNTQEHSVLNAVKTEPTCIDDVVTESKLPIHRVLATLSVLEMRHLIRRISGSVVVRA